MKKKLLVSLTLVTSSLLSGCSSGGLSASNEAVCAEVAEIMKRSGYIDGHRYTLMSDIVELANFEPPAVDDWITYVNPTDGEYRPSLYDNDNGVYANLYRLQEQAISYAETNSRGLFTWEWGLFEEGCGFVEE
jgi:hypothetical protein